MTKLSLKIIVSFVVLVSVLSCNKIFGLCDSPQQPYKALTNSIKLWLPFTKDTNIIFENQLSQIDTIYLKNFFYGDDDIIAGDECPANRGQFIRCNFIDKYSDDTIKTEAGNSNVFYTFRKNTRVLFSENLNNVETPTSYRQYVNSIILNQKIYKDCIWVECTSTDNCSQTGITKYYFAKNKGLIAFIRNNILWTTK